MQGYCPPYPKYNIQGCGSCLSHLTGGAALSCNIYQSCLLEHFCFFFVPHSFHGRFYWIYGCLKSVGGYENPSKSSATVLLRFQIKIKVVNVIKLLQTNFNSSIYEFIEFTGNVFDEPVEVKCKGKVLQVTD